MATWTTVASGIHQRRGGPFDLSVVVIEGDDGLLVVDMGAEPAEAEELLADSQRGSTEPVRQVVNTHAHFDHTFGNQVFGPVRPRMPRSRPCRHPAPFRPLRGTAARGLAGGSVARARSALARRSSRAPDASGRADDAARPRWSRGRAPSPAACAHRHRPRRADPRRAGLDRGRSRRGIRAADVRLGELPARAGPACSTPSSPRCARATS